MATVGIHLIWTTYGTWLPGDDRGHWSPLYGHYGKILERGGKLNRGDLLTQKTARERMLEPAKTLDEHEQRIVAEQIGLLVGGRNQPLALAAAIEATHVHLLLGPVYEHIGTFAGRVKGTASSAILDLPQNAGRQRIWTAKYWKVFLFNDDALFAVKEYIDAHNIRRGLPAAPYDWIRRI